MWYLQDTQNLEDDGLTLKDTKDRSSRQDNAFNNDDGITHGSTRSSTNIRMNRSDIAKLWKIRVRHSSIQTDKKGITA